MNPCIYSEKLLKQTRLRVSLSFAQCFSQHALQGHRSITENDLLLNTSMMGKPEKAHVASIFFHRVED